MRVLLTIQVLERGGGASLYVRDCALELLRQGHHPIVYCGRLGSLADDMRALTIPVIDRLDSLGAPPDVIHGNCPIETVAALLRFPSTPAIFVCHGWDNPDSRPPRFPRIHRYIAVDDTCRDELVCHHGIPEQDVLVRFNAVDLTRFLPRAALPDRPRRALIFSNNASASGYVPAIRQACAANGIDVDVLGQRSGGAVANPEALLGSYDIVFAKARSALEALATGAAVIVCDARGLASLVTTDNYEALRRKNFGWRTLQGAISPESIATELRRYDPEDAGRVTARVRASEGLPDAVRSLVALYEEAVQAAASRAALACDVDRRAAADFLQAVAPFTNTFAATERVEAASRHAEAVERRLASLEAALAMHPLTPADQQQIRLVDLSGPAVVPRDAGFQIAVAIENGSPRFVTSYPPTPVCITYHWLTADRAHVVRFEGQRSAVFPVLPPHASHEYTAAVQAPDEPGRYCLR